MKYAFLVLPLLTSICLSAQQTTEWASFNQQRLATQQKAMYVLGGWSIGNIATSGLLLRGAKGADQDFHRMNMGWNAINLGIAGLGYFSTRKANAQGKDAYASVQEHYAIQKVLLFNAGLDVGYMMGGLYLKERGKTAVDNKDRWTGWGNAIIYNGAFLFVFDLSTYLIHRSHHKQLKKLLANTTLSSNGTGIGLRIQF